MTTAYKHLHFNVIKTLTDEYGYDKEIDIESRLFGACKGGHLELLEDFYSINDLNRGLARACEHNQKEAIKEMIKRGAAICYNCERGVNLHDH